MSVPCNYCIGIEILDFLNGSVLYIYILDIRIHLAIANLQGRQYTALQCHTPSRIHSNLVPFEIESYSQDPR